MSLWWPHPSNHESQNILPSIFKIIFIPRHVSIIWDDFREHESNTFCGTVLLQTRKRKILHGAHYETVLKYTIKKTITQSQYTSSWTIPVIVKVMDTTFTIQVLGSKKKPFETWKKVPRHYPLKLLPAINYHTLV